MRTLLLTLARLFVFSALLASVAHAQWENVTYSLRGGWNAIYLHGDASHTTIDALFAANPEIVSVWRWNSNPTPITIGSSPTIPTPGTSDWNVWVRGNIDATTLSAMVGPGAFLIECTGTSTNTYSAVIPQKVVPPRTTWVRNGANLLGFPTRLATSYPTFANYFATFPVAISTNTRIYKYVGGPIGASNPLQVFSPTFEALDRNQAYWFEAAVVSDFYAPLEISPENPAGLVFDRTGSQMTVRIRNRTAAAVTLTVTPVNSDAPPGGQEAITGPVPLIRNTYDPNTLALTGTPVTGAFTVVVGAQSTAEVNVGVDRSQMTGALNALYASCLRITDGGNLMSISLPVSARVPSLAGLWVGDIAVNGVGSKVNGYIGTGTQRAFPLRVILHVDDSGTVRLLSQVFIGKLAVAPHPLGLCTREIDLKTDEKADARRLVAAHLPLDIQTTSGSGTFGLGATLVRTLSIAFNERTNPFVHTYHPDHDNKDARGNVLATPVESPNIGRTLSFAFATTPPAGSSSVGWGSTFLAGAYSETITGLHKASLNVTGTFELRRVSEIGSITTF